jgi:hypothetical protein
LLLLEEQLPRGKCKKSAIVAVRLAARNLLILSHDETALMNGLALLARNHAERLLCVAVY